MAVVFLPTGLHAKEGSSAQGKINDGIYVSAQGDFSLLVPEFKLKRTIEEGRRGQQICLRLYDGAGDLFRMEICPLPDNLFEVFTTGGEVILIDFFNRTVMPNFRQECPKALIIDQDCLVLNNQQNAYFFLVDLPQSASLGESKDEQKWDTMRGALVFLSGKNLIILSYQTDAAFSSKPKPHVREIKARYSQVLIRAAHSLRFEHSSEQEQSAH